MEKSRRASAVFRHSLLLPKCFHLHKQTVIYIHDPFVEVIINLSNVASLVESSAVARTGSMVGRPTPRALQPEWWCDQHCHNMLGPSLRLEYFRKLLAFYQITEAFEQYVDQVVLVFHSVFCDCFPIF